MLDLSTQLNWWNIFAALKAVTFQMKPTCKPWVLLSLNEISLENMALRASCCMLTLTRKSSSARMIDTLHHHITSHYIIISISFPLKTLIQYVGFSRSLGSQSDWPNQSLNYVVYIKMFYFNHFFIPGWSVDSFSLLESNSMIFFFLPPAIPVGICWLLVICTTLFAQDTAIIISSWGLFKV